MDPNDWTWIVSRLPIFLLGCGVGAIALAALIQARRERVLEFTHFVKTDGQLREMERRRVAEGAGL